MVAPAHLGAGGEGPPRPGPDARPRDCTARAIPATSFLTLLTVRTTGQMRNRSAGRGRSSAVTSPSASPARATNRPPRGVRLHFALGATRIRPSVVRAGVNCRETPATCRHHRNSARQPFPRMRPRTANGAGRRTTTGTAARLSRPMRSPAHRKRRSRCCASVRRWRNSGPMTRSPWPSGPWGSLWSFRRSSQKPKTGRAMPSAMHGQHGTMRGRRWTPRRRYGGLMRRSGVGGAGRGSGRLGGGQKRRVRGGPRPGWRCYRSGYCWLLT